MSGWRIQPRRRLENEVSEAHDESGKLLTTKGVCSGLQSPLRKRQIVCSDKKRQSDDVGTEGAKGVLPADVSVQAILMGQHLLQGSDGFLLRLRRRFGVCLFVN